MESEFGKGMLLGMYLEYVKQQDELAEKQVLKEMEEGGDSSGF